MTPITFNEFASRYCERQHQTPDGLRTILLRQKERFNPTWFIMLECQMLDSTWLGHLCILSYGGSATLQAIPDRPISPRGLASDMSIVVATVNAEDVQ